METTASVTSQLSTMICATTKETVPCFGNRNVLHEDVLVFIDWMCLVVVRSPEVNRSPGDARCDITLPQKIKPFGTRDILKGVQVLMPPTIVATSKLPAISRIDSVYPHDTTKNEHFCTSKSESCRPSPVRRCSDGGLVLPTSLRGRSRAYTGGRS